MQGCVFSGADAGTAKKPKKNLISPYSPYQRTLGEIINLGVSVSSGTIAQTDLRIFQVASTLLAVRIRAALEFIFEG